MHLNHEEIIMMNNEEKYQCNGHELSLRPRRDRRTIHRPPRSVQRLRRLASALAPVRDLSTLLDEQAALTQSTMGQLDPPAAPPSPARRPAPAPQPPRLAACENALSALLRMRLQGLATGTDTAAAAVVAAAAAARKVKKTLQLVLERKLIAGMDSQDDTPSSQRSAHPSKSMVMRRESTTASETEEEVWGRRSRSEASPARRPHPHTHAVRRDNAERCWEEKTAYEGLRPVIEVITKCKKKPKIEEEKMVEEGKALRKEKRKMKLKSSSSEKLTEHMTNMNMGTAEALLNLSVLVEETAKACRPRKKKLRPKPRKVVKAKEGGVKVKEGVGKVKKEGEEEEKAQAEGDAAGKTWSVGGQGGPEVAVSLSDGGVTWPLAISKWRLSGQGHLLLSCEIPTSVKSKVATADKIATPPIADTSADEARQPTKEGPAPSRDAPPLVTIFERTQPNNDMLTPPVSMTTTPSVTPPLTPPHTAFTHSSQLFAQSSQLIAHSSQGFVHSSQAIVRSTQAYARSSQVFSQPPQTLVLTMTAPSASAQHLFSLVPTILPLSSTTPVEEEDKKFNETYPIFATKGTSDSPSEQPKKTIDNQSQDSYIPTNEFTKVVDILHSFLCSRETHKQNSQTSNMYDNHIHTNDHINKCMPDQNELEKTTHVNFNVNRICRTVQTDVFSQNKESVAVQTIIKPVYTSSKSLHEHPVSLKPPLQQCRHTSVPFSQQTKIFDIYPEDKSKNVCITYIPPHVQRPRILQYGDTFHSFEIKASEKCTNQEFPSTPTQPKKKKSTKGIHRSQKFSSLPCKVESIESSRQTISKETMTDTHFPIEMPLLIDIYNNKKDQASEVRSNHQFFVENNKRSETIIPQKQQNPVKITQKKDIEIQTQNKLDENHTILSDHKVRSRGSSGSSRSWRVWRPKTSQSQKSTGSIKLCGDKTEDIQNISNTYSPSCLTDGISHPDRTTHTTLTGSKAVDTAVEKGSSEHLPSNASNALVPMNVDRISFSEPLLRSPTRLLGIPSITNAPGIRTTPTPEGFKSYHTSATDVSYSLHVTVCPPQVGWSVSSMDLWNFSQTKLSKHNSGSGSKHESKSTRRKSKKSLLSCVSRLHNPQSARRSPVLRPITGKKRVVVKSPRDSRRKKKTSGSKCHKFKSKTSHCRSHSRTHSRVRYRPRSRSRSKSRSRSRSPSHRRRSRHRSRDASPLRQRRRRRDEDRQVPRPAASGRRRYHRTPRRGRRVRVELTPVTRAKLLDRSTLPSLAQPLDGGQVETPSLLLLCLTTEAPPSSKKIPLARPPARQYCIIRSSSSRNIAPIPIIKWKRASREWREKMLAQKKLW